jgi:hypothetical protein
VPKRFCKNDAKWRLKTGKPAETLSAHYRLDCDYGTAVIVCWQQGGSEPIYVCESHAKQLGSSREHCPDVRIISTESEQGSSPTKCEERVETEELVGAKTATTAKTNVSPAPEAAPRLAEIKAVRAITERPVRAPARDVTLGSSAKAMVDEGIWNMARGDYQAYKTALQQRMSEAEAARAAGGQLAFIYRKVREYTLRLEGVFLDSKAKINLGQAIDRPLEQAMLDVIGNATMSDPEKDAAIQQLGTLQEWAKNGLRGDITPLEANQILLAIGERLNWGGRSGVSEEFKPAYRALYGSLKTAIRAAVPEAENLHERLTNLYVAKSDLDIG